MAPHKDIYFFEGQIFDRQTNKCDELSLKQFIPKGCTIKNSKEVFGLVIYTGKDTKLVLNQGKYIQKMSHMSMLMNYYLFLNICLLFILDVLMSQLGNRFWNEAYANEHYYIFPEAQTGRVEIEGYVRKSFFSYYLLFNGVIPLDLVIQFAMVKLIYIGFIESDANMIDVNNSINDAEIKTATAQNF